MQVSHTELPVHAGEGKAKKKEDHIDVEKKHTFHEPHIDHKKELIDKMRHIKPKE